ncbi:MAG: transposase, family, partial [Candidatus Solibacter sp.]|nr:transposase, family [Candidatus Solibacter sp.]
KKKIPQIAAALEGHQMSDHHRKLIRYSLEHMSFLEEQILELDKDIEAKIKEAGIEREWELLQTVPGVKEQTGASILAETGPDMTQFPSSGQISSWAGVCPGNNRSAGKSRSRRPTKGNPFLRGALSESAWAAVKKKNCFLKEKFWRITTKSKGVKTTALVAIAHNILLLIYEVLRTGKPYQDHNPPPLTEAQKERLIRHHTRRLGKLGVRMRSKRPEGKPHAAAKRTQQPIENK